MKQSVFLIFGLLLSAVSALFLCRGLALLRSVRSPDSGTVLSAVYLSAMIIVSSLTFMVYDDRLVVSVVGTHMSCLVFAALATVLSVKLGTRSDRNPVLFLGGGSALFLGIICYRQYMPFVTGTVLLSALVACALFWIYMKPSEDDSCETPFEGNRAVSALCAVMPLILTPVAAHLMVEGGLDIMSNQYFLSVCFAAAIAITVIPSLIYGIRRHAMRRIIETCLITIVICCAYVVIGGALLPLVLYV